MTPRFKTPKQPSLDRAGAEAMAASALAFLTADSARLTRFLADTGLDPQTLAQGLSDGGAGVIDAALEHVMADESLLLVFASEVRRKPEEIMAAQHILAGPAPDRSV
jgi:Protein of unknown function (DUF3572)